MDYSEVTVINGTLYKNVKMVTHCNCIFRIVVIKLPPRSTKVFQSLAMPTLRICRVLKGNGVWLIGDNEYDIEEGDIFILNNTERRSIPVIYPPEGLLLQILDFEPRFICSDLNNMFDMSYLRVFFEKPASKGNRLHHDLESAKQINTIMHNMQHEMVNTLPEYKQMVKVMLQHILVILNRYYISRINEYHFNSLPPKVYFAQLEQVLSYIENHISEDIKIEDLAKIVNMSMSHFRKIFKKYNGMSVTQYILKRRVLKVIEMIKNDDVKIMDAGFRCGFNNLSNLYKAFNNVTGKPPAYFKKNEII